MATIDKILNGTYKFKKNTVENQILSGTYTTPNFEKSIAPFRTKADSVKTIPVSNPTSAIKSIGTTMKKIASTAPTELPTIPLKRDKKELFRERTAGLNISKEITAAQNDIKSWENTIKKKTKSTSEPLPLISEINKEKGAVQDLTPNIKKLKEENAKEQKRIDDIANNESRMKELESKINTAVYNPEKKREWLTEYALLSKRNEKLKDVSQVNLLGTIGNLYTSAMSATEDLAKDTSHLINAGIAQMYDWAGNYDRAEQIRENIKEAYQGKDENFNKIAVMKNMADKTQKQSLLGKAGSEQSYQLGQLLSFSVLPESVMASSSAGRGYADTLSKGGNNEQAWLRGSIRGGISYGTEHMGGFFGKTGADDALANYLSNKVSNKIAKYLIRQGVTGGAEALEELAEYGGDQLLDLAMDKTSGKNSAKFHEDWNWNDVSKDMLSAFLTSQLGGAAQTAMNVNGIKAETGSTYSQAFDNYMKSLDAKNDVIVGDQRVKVSEKGILPTIETVEEQTQNNAQTEELNENNTINQEEVKTPQNRALNEQIAPVKTTTTPTTTTTTETTTQTEENLVERLKEMRAEVTNKTEQAKLDAYIQQLENEIKKTNDNSSTFAQENKTLEQRVSGDELLDAQNLIEELKSVGAEIDNNGYVTLYHQTTPENAQQIRESGKMTSKENDVFFSTSKNATQSDGRGTEKLEFRIPAEKLQLDDIFSDNADVKVPLNGQKDLDISNYIVKQQKSDINSLKEQQLNIINESNPMQDDYHTGVRTVDDIKTLPETLNDSDYEGYDEFNPDLTRQDIENAIKKGTITVYSSYPIENGVFVSPSKMEAQSYSGNGNVYSKEVNINDVAWIDPTQGQYAKVQSNIPIKQTKGNIPIKEELLNKYNNVKEIFDNESMNYDGIVNIKNIDVNISNKNATNLYHDAVNIFKENHNTNHFKNDGNDIIVTNQDIKESINKIYNDKLQNKYMQEHLKVFSDLGDIIENAKLVNQTVENKNRTKYNTWNYYYNNLDIDGIKYNLEFDVVSREDGENHYRLQRLKKASAQSTLPIKGEVDFRAPASGNDITTNQQKSQIPVKETKTNIPMVKSDNVKQIKFTENDYKKIADSINSKPRSWIETSLDSKTLEEYQPELIKGLKDENLTYVVQSNKSTLDKANKKLSTMKYENAVAYIESKLYDEKNMDLTDIALTERLIQEASKKGDYQTASDLIQDLAIVGTDLGQKVQALSLIKKLTPEGQLSMYQKVVNRAKAKGEFAFEDVEITPEMVKTILDAYDKNGNYDQADLNERVEKFKEQVAEQLKSTTSDKLNAWRYLSMLGNPKTHIRNIVSNVAMKGTLKVKNAMARTLESIAPIKQENRTKTWKSASSEVKQFAKQTAIEMKDTITGENKYNEKTQIEQKKKIFNNKFLEKASNFNGAALEFEDWLFSRSAFESTFREYLTAQGIRTQQDIQNNPEIVEKGKQYAVEQAEIATFRQYSRLAADIAKIERKSKLGKLAIEALVPFKKTPINVAKAGLNYSPLGLAKSVFYDSVQLQKGNINGSQFIDNLSQGMTGTSLALLGYMLAKAGILTGAGEDDKEGKYDKQLGNQTYAINLGGNSYSISWLSPVAMPLLVGANSYESLERQEGWDPNIVVDSLASTLDPLSSMSFVSGLTDALNSYNKGSANMIKDMGLNTAESYILQYVPTLLSQVASVTDDKKRSTTPSNNSKFKWGEKVGRQIMYKIPGLRQQLEISTDIWGNDKEQSSNIAERAFETFLAPYSKTKHIATEVDDEIKNIYGETGNNGVLPGVPYGYIKYGDETYRMSAKEYTQYKKTYGQTANSYISDLINTDSYKNASDDIKAKMIDKVYDYARAEANEKYFNNYDVDYTSNTLQELNDLKDIGISSKSFAEYLADKTQIASIRSSSNYTSEEKKDMALDIFTSSELNNKQLSYLYGKYYSTTEKLNALNSVNMPIKEFIKYDLQDFRSDYNSRGKLITGSKQRKVMNYVNSLNLSVPQKALLIKMEYNKFNGYDDKIEKLINSSNGDFLDKAYLVKQSGFSGYDKQIIKYVFNNYSTAKEREKVLKSLGFTVRNGRVY